MEGHTALGSVQLRVLKGCGRVVIGLDVSPSCFMRRKQCVHRLHVRVAVLGLRLMVVDELAGHEPHLTRAVRYTPQ